MKKIIFSLYFSLVCLLSFGQLQGSFRYAEDGHLYFYLTNPTEHQILLVWGVDNLSKNQHRLYDGVMMPYTTFVYGPNYNWVWEKGERFTITHKGQTVYWTCPETDPALRNRGNISFRGGDWTAVSVNVSKCKGFGGSLCSCKTYKGYKRTGLNQYRGNCTNYAGGHQCGHGPSAHGLSEY